MGNGKASSGSRILNMVLLLLNLALFVWIVLSWRGQKHKPMSAEEYYSSLGYDVSVLTGGNGDDGGGTSSDDGISAASSAVPSSGGSQSAGGRADSWFFDEEPSSEPAQTAGGTDSGLLQEKPSSGQAQTEVQTGATYSTTARPERSDFDGWKEHGGKLPAGASVLTDFSMVSGSWKGFIQYDMAEELVNFTISEGQSGVSLTVDWYLIHYFGDGSWMNEEDMEDVVYPASWADGVLTAAGGLTVTIRSFYEIGGAQYAVGEMTLQDGSAAVIGMVRP